MTRTNPFGIKEVADVTFHNLADGLSAENDFKLDTLKISNIEITADSTSAKGGKGNPDLIMWDYNKEITLSIEDAVMSSETMKALLGKDGTNEDGSEFVIDVTPNDFPGYYKIVGTTFARDQATGEDTDFTFTIEKAKLMPNCTLTMEADGDPTVFSMELKVMSNGTNKPMMTLKKKPVTA